MSVESVVSFVYCSTVSDVVARGLDSEFPNGEEIVKM